jgi:glycosyltransferase involved in cell wall biosynthesis
MLKRGCGNVFLSLVLSILLHDPVLWGSVGSRFLPLARALSRRGHRVKLLCFGAEGIDRTSIIQESKNLSILVLPLPRTLFFKDLVWLLHKLPYFIKSLKGCDIIHAGTFWSPHIGITDAIGKYPYGKRLVVEMVDLFGFGWFMHHTALQIINERIADHIVVLSEPLAKWCMNRGVPPSKITVIPAIVDLNRIKGFQRNHARSLLGLPINKLMLGYESGGFVTDSIIELLLASFKNVLNIIPAATLAFIGDFKRYNALDRIRQHLKYYKDIKDNIIFSGKVSDNELSLWLSACDVLLLPQEDSSPERARIPGRFGDYLAVGRPTVTTDVGDVARIVSKESCGLVARAGDVADFSNKVLTLLRDNDLITKLGSKAKDAAPKYSWDNLVRVYEKIYSELC